MSADTRLLSTRPTGSWESSGSFFSRLSPLTLESNHFKIIQTPHSLRGTFYPDNKSIRWFEQQPADAHYLTLFVISLDLSRSKTHSSQFGDTINEPSHPSPTPTSSPSTDQSLHLQWHLPALLGGLLDLSPPFLPVYLLALGHPEWSKRNGKNIQICSLNKLDV